MSIVSYNHTITQKLHKIRNSKATTRLNSQLKWHYNRQYSIGVLVQMDLSSMNPYGGHLSINA